MVTSLRSKWAAGKAVRAGLAIEGAYLNRYVTDEQRGRPPIFNATLRAAVGWLFFCVARSTRMTQIWALYRQSGSDRLEKQPTDLRRRHHYMRDGTLGPTMVSRCATSDRAGARPYRAIRVEFLPAGAYPILISPRSDAIAIASVRPIAFNFFKMTFTWLFTVYSLM